LQQRSETSPHCLVADQRTGRYHASRERSGEERTVARV
jgi:hypothetical protein